MKKILVLVMYCNQQFFIEEEQLIRDTWAKDIIEGKYPNIDFYSYTASEDGKYHFDKKNKRFYIPCNDGLKGTAEKTVKCFRFIEKLGIKYDYIFRTNTSTYINIQLLYEYIQTLYESLNIYTCNSCMAFIDAGPYKYCETFGGNSAIISKKMVNEIILNNDLVRYSFDIDTSVTESNNFSVNQNAIFTIDDNYVSLLINSYYIKNKKDHSKYYKRFGFVGNDSYIDFNPFNLNLISISYRFSGTRETEFAYARMIHEKLTEKNNNKRDLSDTFEVLHNNDETFIGFDYEKRECIRDFVSHEYLINDLFKQYNIKIPYTSNS